MRSGYEHQQRPSVSKMMLRGAVRRCAWCGQRGAFFTGWFAKSDSCSRCGLQWRRGDVGFELGAAAIAAVIVMGPLMVALGVVAIATWPNLQAIPMMIVLGVGGLVLPILLYPVSHTLWQALDILMRPPEPEHFSN